MELDQIFGSSAGAGSGDKVEKIIAITERMNRIDRAIDKIKYDDNLLVEAPEAIKTLGAAKDAAIAELKTL